MNAAIPRDRLGTILEKKALLSKDALALALGVLDRREMRLGAILRRHGLISERHLIEALSQQYEMRIIDLGAHPPDPNIVRLVPSEICLKHGFMAWRRLGDVTIIATSDPAAILQNPDILPDTLGKIALMLAEAPVVERLIEHHSRDYLSMRANSICPEKYSCREWAKPLNRPLVYLGFAILISAIFAFPKQAIVLFILWTFFTLIATSTLRIVALYENIARRWRTDDPQAILTSAAGGKFPLMSILVPLHREEKVLAQLIHRLSLTTYPKESLEVCLILESDDLLTRLALSKLHLPDWIRVVFVPPSSLRTKPRAMNYALDFCKGSIIGIYDAEDMPDPDQLEKVMRAFQTAPPDVACLQGYLDFYNARQNWLSRCFTIEYATWFRVVMNGIEKLGLPVPLGGTTVFFRREALERLGAWDAHNVTEDADLGYRLARLGYKCNFFASTTKEEANCRPLAWIKQRSRWLKGYGMTWITHMRDPVCLWRDLGPVAFLTFQVQMLGTLSSFLLAPFIWTMWLVSFGVDLPYYDLMPKSMWHGLIALFVFSELLLMIVGFYAVSGRDHRHLRRWVPSMILYWPLGTLAVYKAMYELLLAPFYWDKTDHGHGAEDPVSDNRSEQPLQPLVTVAAE